MSEFTDYLIELFEQLGQVSVRKMFSGYGIYHQRVMFGMVAEEALYLKADASTAEQFESRALGQFEYNKGGKIIRISYYLAPAELLEDPEQAALWARRSFEVACRTGTRRGGSKVK